MVAMFTRPGWYRAVLCTVLAAAFGVGIVVVMLRAISGLPAFQSEQTGYPQVVVPLITAPLGFLLGIGCFDYWLRWGFGAADDPRRPLRPTARTAGRTTSRSTPTTR